MNPASVRLLIHIIAKNTTQGKSFEQTCNELRNIGDAVKKARAELEQYIAIVRTANDADPNWTEDEVCQMIIDRLVEKDSTLFRNIK